jgi:5-methylcytosine-specific restriction endonuclease McrA
LPHRVPTFRPPWLAKRREARASSSGRGYGSAAWQKVRRLVIARDGSQCRHCHILIHRPGDAQVDHIEEKPQSEAAEATPLDGLQLLCRSCHSAKTAKTALETS